MSLKGREGQAFSMNSTCELQQTQKVPPIDQVDFQDEFGKPFSSAPSVNIAMLNQIASKLKGGTSERQPVVTSDPALSHPAMVPEVIGHQAMCTMPDGSEFPSEGSQGHFTGACKPCLFWYSGSCLKAEKCPFCHITHDADEVRKVRPSKATRNLLKRNRDRSQAQN
jgi:hypothetical protein